MKNDLDSVARTCDAALREFGFSRKGKRSTRRDATSICWIDVYAAGHADPGELEFYAHFFVKLESIHSYIYAKSADDYRPRSDLLDHDASYACWDASVPPPPRFQSPGGVHGPWRLARSAISAASAEIAESVGQFWKSTVSLACTNFGLANLILTSASATPNELEMVAAIGFRERDSQLVDTAIARLGATLQSERSHIRRRDAERIRSKLMLFREHLQV
jgi:hypothetical protein